MGTKKPENTWAVMAVDQGKGREEVDAYTGTRNKALGRSSTRFGLYRPTIIINLGGIK